MSTLCVPAGLLVLCLFGLSSVSAGNEAAADPDAAARAVVAGRSRVVTILMNVVKCTQKASSDINKMLMDILADLAACAKKPDAFEVVKCMMSDAGLKKLSAAVLKTLEVVKCSLD